MFKKKIFQAWLQPDPRTLGLFRIAFGSLLIFHLLKRFSDIPLMYVETGLIPYQSVPHKLHEFNILGYLNQTPEVTLFFVFSLLSLFCFTIGYRTKLFQFLSLIALITIHDRAPMLNNGAQRVMTFYLTFTLFLPLAQRFSIDSIRNLNKNSLFEQTKYSQKTYLIYFVCLFQFSVVYFFSFANKQNNHWTDGTAIYYLLQLDRYNTDLGYALRDHLPLWFTVFLSYFTLVTEALLSVLILSPWGIRWTRKLAIFCVFALHLSISLLSHVGLFSPTMMVVSILLLTQDDLEYLRKILNKIFAKRFTIIFKLFIDFRQKIQFKLEELFKNTQENTQEINNQSNLLEISTRLNNLKIISGELIAFILIISIAIQAFNNNLFTRNLFEEISYPHFLKQTLSTLRIQNQRWSMFAPRMSEGENWIVIDAQLSDGRHLDPQTGKPPVMTPLHQQSGFDFNQSWRKYVGCLTKGKCSKNHEPLKNWLLARKQHLKLSADQEIVAFEVWIISERSPPPEKRFELPSIKKKIKILSYP